MLKTVTNYLTNRSLLKGMGQNQHYVPQFYLRSFSTDHINISIFNFGRLEIYRGPISKQCAKPNFYSRNQEVESAFSQLESKIASIVKKIIDKQGLSIDGEEYAALLSYILFQSGRTNKAGEEMLKRINDLFSHLKPDLANMEEAKKLGLTLDLFNKVRLSHRSPAVETSLRALMSAPLLFDMQPTIIINASDVEFITSDSPVVLFNTYFNGKTKGLQTGYASKGLQIFFPLTPKLMIILYDPNYYTIPFKEDLTYAVKKNKDVRRLNGLQVIFGFDNLYFREYRKPDLHQQFTDLRKRRDEKTLIESMGIRPYGENYAELIHTTKDNAIYDLTKLSFLTVNPNAENSPGVRNWEVLIEHRKQMERMIPKRRSTS